MRHLILVLRPLNLTIIAIIQWMTYYFLHVDSGARELWKTQLGWLLLATLATTAAGYIINDWLDTEADKINKPRKVYLAQLTFAAKLATYLIWLCVGLFAAWMVSSRLLTIILAIDILLALYSFVLKRTPLVGNLLVSAMAFLCIYLVYWTFMEQDFALVLFFASFSGLVTFVREQVKTIEDVKGDEATGYKTLPVLIGLGRATNVARYTLVVVAVIYMNLLWQWLLPQFPNPMRYIFGVYQVTCVLFPMIVILRWTYRVPTQTNIHEISSLLKYVMITGSLSMLFF